MELKEVSHYVVRYEEKMQNLATDFKEKNYLQLVWDSKVPEHEKTWYYFFSASASDRGEVIAEIKKYERFYQEMGEAIQKVRRPEEKGSSSQVDLYHTIRELQDVLKKMHDAAKQGEHFTSSSTLYNLHRSFQKQHAELNNMIKRVECVALKSSLKGAKEACKKEMNEVKSMKDNVQKLSMEKGEISEKYNKLSVESQKTQDTMAKVLQNGKNENKSLKEDVQKLSMEKVEISEKYDKLSVENQKTQDTMAKVLQNGKSEINLLKEDVRKLSMEKDEISEKYDKMIVENQKTQDTMAKVLASAKNEINSLKEDVRNLSMEKVEISEKFEELSLEQQRTQNTMAQIMESNRKMEQTIEKLTEFIRSERS